MLHVYGGGVDGSGYELLVGDPSEGRPYRVLAQQEEEDDDEDDDDEEDDEDGPGPILRIRTWAFLRPGGLRRAGGRLTHAIHPTTHTHTHTAKAITRQFVVAHRAPTTPGRCGVSDSDGEEDASPASLPPPAVPLVVPYAPIAQVPNLRVRFLPAGAGTAPPPPLSDGEGPAKGPTKKDKDKGKDKRRRSEGEASSPDAEDGGKHKKKKKEKKR